MTISRNRLDGLGLGSRLRILVSCLLSPALVSLASCDPSTGSTWDIFQGDDFRVRSKATSPDICAGESGLSGYVDWGDDEQNHLFFWAFESRHDPSNDPVILWLTGGPGASGVAYGGLRELGPCTWNSKAQPPSTEHNAFSWNSNATVIFVDQPLNVGFSHGQKVRSLRQATLDLEAFLQRLFEAKPEWGARDFYIAGESYGGSYVPSLGTQLYRSRTLTLSNLASSTSSRSMKPINLKGIMVGNGLMDQIVQRRGFYEMGCTGEKHLLTPAQCADMAETAPRCERLEEACRKSGFQRAVCDVSDAFCQKHQWFQILSTPWFPYDVRINCKEDPDACQDPPPSLLEWLNTTTVRAALGVDDEVTGARPSNMEVFKDFSRSGEIGYPSHQWVTELLDGGLRVLIYAGDKDWLCTSTGMREYVDQLAWRGTLPFRAKTLDVVEARCAGECGPTTEPWGHHKSFENLSFMQISNAGHMAPGDQPEVSLAMLNGWLAGEL